MSVPKKYQPQPMLAGLTPARLDQLQSGETLLYHRGFLFIDRQNKDLDNLADAAWQLYASGRALLVQKRIDRFQYEYSIVMRHVRGPAMAQTEFAWTA